MKTENIPNEPPLSNTRGMDRLNFAIVFEKHKEVLLKRWSIIAICFAVSLVCGGYIVYNKPDIYMAHGSMMVRPRVNVQVGVETSEDLVNFYGTQVRLMKSKQVIGAAQAKLSDYANTFPSPPSADLLVMQEKGTSIFALTATSTSPEYARRFLDHVMKEYIAYKKKIRGETTESASATILHEIERLDKERQKAEAELLEFQKQNNMAYYKGQGNMAVQYLIDLKRRLAEVRTEMDLLDTETAEQHLNRAGVKVSSKDSKTTSDSGSSTVNDSVAISKDSKLQSEGVSLRNSIALLRADRENLSKFLLPKHPKIIQIDEEIEHKERMLKIIYEQTKEQIAAYRESLVKQQEALQKSIADWEKQALEANQKAGQYTVLESNVARPKEFYDVLLKQLQQIDVGTNMEQEMIAISEPAHVSSIPIGPHRTKEVFLAALYGLIAGIGIVFFLDRFDDRVKTLEDLQDALPETSLGQVPMMPEEIQGEHEPLVMANLPSHNAFSESFRNIRSSLMFSPLGGKAKSIVVTSAIPGDGKTTCAVNLAVCLAQLENAKTLLIDADMRRTNVHHYFKMQNGEGLSEVLSGQATLDQDLIVATPYPNLHVLRAGSIPPNPGELVLSENFTVLLAELSKYYHRIIIDTPPILATGDTLSLAPVVDGVVFVVKANATSLRFVHRSIFLLKQRGATIFGLILNGISTSSANYYYYYHYSNYYHGTDGQHLGLKEKIEQKKGPISTPSTKTV